MRSAIRISDLKQRTRGENRIMNIHVPVKVADAIARLARQLDVSKTAVIVALLNEGLNVAAQKTKSLRGLGRRPQLN
jgi:hypothetical protein